MNRHAPPHRGASHAVRSPAGDELRIASRALEHGLYQTDLSVPGVHCAGCIRKVEAGLSAVSGVEHVRVNLSTRRASIRWRGETPPPLIETLSALGFPAHLYQTEDEGGNPELGRLIRALAVAGFAAMNIMLLSVSVWSGAEPGTRQAFHWISAALALPCLIYSGRIFFVSAWGALRRGRTNMDVPISVGISLAFGLSLYDTLHGGEHAYFDATASLIFFLLIGRTLDILMRDKARKAVRGLARMAPRGALVLHRNGDREYLPVAEIEPGMRILLAAGDRIPVDGVIEAGRSELDCSIVTGESAARTAEPGVGVQAGVLNLTGPLTMTATTRAQDSFLAEMLRLMEAAEDGRVRYRRVADRAASLYSPLVHASALLTFLGWMAATGDWHRAISIAIAVLIITCPCALGLAVPIVQVVAARRLFENGVMLKDGAGIERLALIDTAVFDKTGTLTFGEARLANAQDAPAGALAIAALLGAHSNHPHSRALARLLPVQASSPNVTELREESGFGIEGRVAGKLYRLGRADWALREPPAQPTPGTVLSCEGLGQAVFRFEEQLRSGAAEAINALRVTGVDVQILSGDGAIAVTSVARSLHVENYASGLLPGDKVRRLRELACQGRKVLMVGDGLNDAPALAGAYVSMAPITAADVGRNAADLVFLGENLYAVPTAIDIARRTDKLVRQNFALAVGYNAIALPVAILGHVTPLLAALAMSSSSILVVANALRLKGARQPVAARIVAGAASANPSWAR